MEFYTIGVYNSTEEEYFEKLQANNIDTFCDIRQRRGVRGSKYAFVNSNRLQQRLRDLGINYGHVIGLAPTTEIRELQKIADSQMGEYKRNRDKLGSVFSRTYHERILKQFDFEYFLEQLNHLNAQRVVLFCVEEKHEACHRSLVAEELTNQGYIIQHL